MDGEVTLSSIGRIVHLSPGRLRLRVSQSHRSPETFAEIKRLVTALPGVGAVQINATTGSVLVAYDPDTLDVAELLKLGSELGWADAGDAGTLWPRAISWRSQIDVPRATRGVALLGVVALGAVAGRTPGLGARAGSLSAAVAYLMLGRRIRQRR